VAGLFDINGSRTPNRVGKDVQYMNGAKIKDAVLAKIGNYKIIKQADIPPAMDCSKYKGNAKYPEIITCPESGKIDRWVGAVVTCRDIGGHLPNMNELAGIAAKVYKSNVDTYGGVRAAWDQNMIKDLGINSAGISHILLWSSEEYEDDLSLYRAFDSDRTWGNDHTTRHGSNTYFICLAN
ncbi:hypothetical protein IJ579_08500, partial [bacterium]|nr:hypothetical protein [bacterium]